MTGRTRVAVLISGRGSNMAALIAAAANAEFPAEIVAVVSNRPGAGGLVRAAEAGITTAVVDHTAHHDRAAFEAELERVLGAYRVDLVCLAGFMRIFTPAYVERWLGRMLNVHPSLLPSFKGLHPHRQALEAGVRVHGCTVHFVTPELDSGPIVVQAAVPVLPDDDEDALASRVIAAEHRLYPLGLRLVASGQAVLKAGRTVMCSGDRTALGLAEAGDASERA